MTYPDEYEAAAATLLNDDRLTARPKPIIVDGVTVQAWKWDNKMVGAMMFRVESKYMSTFSGGSHVFRADSVQVPEVAEAIRQIVHEVKNAACVAALRGLDGE